MPYRRNTAPRRKPDNTMRYVRNAALILTGVLMIVILFRAEGRFDFNPRGNGESRGSFMQKIIFPGPLKPENIGLSTTDFKPLDDLLAAEGKHYKQARIHIEKQDSYTELTENSQLRFWLVLVMNDGKTIKSVVTRATGKTLVDRVTWRLKEDLKQYRDVRQRYGKERPIDSFTNTM